MSAPTVFLVDDDAAVRDGVSMLLETDGLAVEAYESAERFLASFDKVRAGCLVLDVAMPGVTGPQLQDELRRRGSTLPIIFLTALGESAATVHALKGSAHDFLAKPADGGQLLERVREAIARDLAQREQAEPLHGDRR